MGNPRHCTTNLLKAHHSSLRYSMGICHITELQPHHTQNFIQSVYPITMATLHYLPPVKPSAIALGVVFTQASAAAALTPLFGDTYNRAKAADSKEEFFKSRETATAAASWGSSIVGSGIQTYGVAALLNATGTLSYKGAAYLGSLVFFASAGPGLIAQVVSEKHPLDIVAVGVVSRVFETVGFVPFPHLVGHPHQPLRLNFLLQG